MKKCITFAPLFGNSNISKNLIATIRVGTICTPVLTPALSPNVSQARRRRSLAADTTAAG